MPGAGTQYLTVLVTSMVVTVPAAAQAATDSTFDQRARAVWIAAADDPAEFRSGSIPVAIARLADLTFQARADRLTPDLDSALALSVMSFGALRDSPWGWFALARQLQRTRGSCAPASELAIGDWAGHCRRVYQAYTNAIELDSSFAPAIADLDVVVPPPRLFAEPELELALVSAAVGWRDLPDGVGARLARRRALLLGTYGTEEALGRLLARGGEGVLTNGESRFLGARHHAMAGRGTTALSELDRVVADRGPGDHQEWLRQELVLVATAGEIAEWDSLGMADRRSWLVRFWADRDFAEGVAPGTRFVEHVERVRVAHRDFRMWYRDALLGVGALRPHTPECAVDPTADEFTRMVLGCGMDSISRGARVLDDRGLTYVRHGEPMRKANYTGIWHLALESWLYTTASGPVVIHFGRPPDESDRGMRARSVAGPPDQWLASCEVTPRYCVLAARESMGDRIPPDRMLQVAERGAEEMKQLLTTDGAPQRFRQGFRFNAGSYGLGRAPGRLTLAVDAPLEELRKLITSDTSRVALRWQVRIRGLDGEWPVSIDSAQSLSLPVRSRDGDNGRYLTLAREFALPPGTYDLRLVLSDSAGTTGAMYSRDGFVMIGGESPNLSDLLLMPDGAQGAARTIEGNPVRISPTFTPGSARFVQVGYLLTGFAGQDVRVTVAVTEVGKADGVPRISVSFSDRPSSNREFRTQRLGLERLGNGAWDLTVSALLPDGTTVSRVQRMVVRR
jgi:hypothetical protein